MDAASKIYEKLKDQYAQQELTSTYLQQQKFQAMSQQIGQAMQNDKIQNDKELFDKMYAINPDYAVQYKAAQNGVYMLNNQEKNSPKTMSCSPNSPTPVAQPRCHYICVDRKWAELCN